MLTGASNGNAVEDFKEVKTERFKQSFSGTIFRRKFGPAVKSSLRLTENIVKRACRFQFGIHLRRIPLVSECKLIAQVVEAVVDRGG